LSYDHRQHNTTQQQTTNNNNNNDSRRQPQKKIGKKNLLRQKIKRNLFVLCIFFLGWFVVVIVDVFVVVVA